MARYDTTIIDIIELAALAGPSNVAALSDRGAAVVDRCEYVTIINPGTTAGALTTVTADADGVTKEIPLLPDSVWTEKCSLLSELLITSGDAAMTIIMYSS